MAVKEFLDAVDKKNKEEEAAMAADAPVSAEVVPVAAAQIPNIPLEQALIQTSRDIVEYGKSGDAAPTVLGTPAPATPAMQAPVATPQQLDQMLADPATVNVDDVTPAAPSVLGTSAPVAPAQTDVLASAPTVQAPAVQAETPLFQPTGIGRRVARDVGSAVDAVAADLISQSTGGRINLQSSPEFGQASTSTAGAPITDASQLREFMSGLNEQAQIQAPTQVAAPVPTANLSVNGTDVVTPEAITEAGQAAPVAVAPQVPQVGSGGMITRDLTGESFIGGSQTAATPEEVAAYGNTSAARMAAANTDEAARERMRYNAPTIAEATGAGQTPAPRAPTRQSTEERDRSEKTRADALRREGKRSIDDQMREFNREPHSTKERAAEKARLQGELNASIKEDRDYNRATEEAGFAESTAQYNRGTLTAAQRATVGKQTANEQKLSSIKAANPSLSDADAAAIAAGVVRVVQNPLSGETQLLNIATGESRKVGAEQGTDVDFDVAVPEKTLYGRIGQFTGAVEGTKRKLQALGGQVGVDVATDESLEAAQDFKAAQNQLVRAFKQSDRYSATESKQLKEELGIDLSLFEDPKTAEAKLRSADQTLARNYENEIATYQDTSFPSKDRQDARLRAKAIAEFRALIGVPEKGATPVEGGTAPANIDAGDWKYMTEEQRKLFN